MEKIVIPEFIVKLMGMKFTWLTDILTLVTCWGSKRGVRIVCCSRSATAKLIVRQRGVATELTNTIPAAITATESLERTMSKHLPPGDSLCTTLSSPQFSQALSMFWSALQSGQASPVVRQFGLGADAVNAAATGNLEEFVSALEGEGKSGAAGQAGETEEKKAEAKGEGAPSSEKKDDGEDPMALD
ncbi:proteasomal ubiquitin receptor ADRM1-like [Diachasma alloeum]|uniref:proteasomal ubiquitin receptor ADRM1-like n=1 Tax=Diachasma alloeum TaxID=454923 RepID=UPI000738263A|nr:proteasomal ubiquitin receptor ADRM1-like [Diachasma alloeum]